MRASAPRSRPTRRLKLISLLFLRTHSFPIDTSLYLVPSFMVVSRCSGIGPPSSSVVLGTLFVLAADLRRHPTSGILGIPLPALLSNIPYTTVSYIRLIMESTARDSAPRSRPTSVLSLYITYM